MPLSRLPEVRVYNPIESIGIYEAVKDRNRRAGLAEREMSVREGDLEASLLKEARAAKEQQRNITKDKWNAQMDYFKEVQPAMRKKTVENLPMALPPEMEQKFAITQNMPEDVQQKAIAARDEALNKFRQQYLYETTSNNLNYLHETGQFEPAFLSYLEKQAKKGLSIDTFMSSEDVRDFHGLGGEETDVKSDQLTITNIADPTQTQRVYPDKDGSYTPPEGWMIGKRPSGTKMTVGEDGEVVVEIGTDMTTKTQGTIEGKLLGAKEAKTRMEGIYSKYDPQYLEFMPRLGFAWSEFSEKAGRKLPEEEQKNLIAFNEFKSRAMENTNLYIKEITGAQMSEKEADRLRIVPPDVGENWWQGDSPTEFKAKLDDNLLRAQAAELRFNWYLKKGMAKEAVVDLIKSDAAKPLDKIVDALREANGR